MTITTITCICEQCGKEFQRRPIDIAKGGGHYCSNKCTGIARRKTVECVCKTCNKTFEVIPSNAQRGAKFCSYECYHLSMHNQIECTCKYCGRTFMTPPSKSNKQRGFYCSRKCHSAANSGAANPVWRGGHTHYRGNNWSIQRRLARERDGNVCQSCHRKPRKSEKLFHIHHIKPFRYFNGDYLSANDLSNLITLCPTCHKKAEWGKLAITKPLL